MAAHLPLAGGAEHSAAWRRRAVLGGGVGALASFLIPGEGVGAQRPEPTDASRLKTGSVRQTVSPGRTLAMYLAVPGQTRGRKPAVMIVHDAAGLDDRTREIARRVAMLGYVACAPDLLSRSGGTPPDPDLARAASARLDPAEVVNDAAGTAGWLGHNPPGERVLTGRVAALGLGWSAGVVERLTAVPGLLTAALLCDDAGPANGAAVAPLPVLYLRTDELAPRQPWPAASAFLRDHLRAPDHD